MAIPSAALEVLCEVLFCFATVSASVLLGFGFLWSFIALLRSTFDPLPSSDMPISGGNMTHANCSTNVSDVFLLL